MNEQQLNAEWADVKVGLVTSYILRRDFTRFKKVIDDFRLNHDGVSARRAAHRMRILKMSARMHDRFFTFRSALWAYPMRWFRAAGYLAERIYNVSRGNSLKFVSLKVSIRLFELSQFCFKRYNLFFCCSQGELGLLVYFTLAKYFFTEYAENESQVVENSAVSSFFDDAFAKIYGVVDDLDRILKGEQVCHEGAESVHTDNSTTKEVF